MRVHPQLWWFVTRSSGVVSWALCALSVIWGLLLSTRLLGRKPAGPWLLDLHRFLGALSIAFVGVHLGALVADTYTHWGPTDLLVPFASSWKPGPVAWGIVAFYLLVAIEVTSLLRSRIPKRLWHGVHLTSFALYAASTVHLFTAGTDAPGPLTYAAVTSIAVVAFLTVFRVLAAKDKPASAARRIPQRPVRPAA